MPENEFSLSHGEKLILLMLCDIYEKLNITNSFNPEIIEEAIRTGNIWAINRKYRVSAEADIPESDVIFVCNVLDMYTSLNYSYNLLSVEEKKKLSSELGIHGEKENFNFPGFDGNHEFEYGSIACMLHKIGRYKSQNVTVNSHTPKVGMYKRMLHVFTPLLELDSNDSGLSYESLKEVMRAQKYRSLIG